MGRGIAMTIANGEPKTLGAASDAFSYLGSGFLLGIPVPIWIFIAIAAAAYVILSRTPFGRQIYAVGSNTEAARLAGIDLLLTGNLERDLPQAAALVYLTHAEGLGSAALLAMSAGVPVIASRVGGLPEVVHDRETGLLAENEPAAVAAAIGELAGDLAFARRLGEAARRAVVENFTVDHMVRRTMEVYRKVLL